MALPWRFPMPAPKPPVQQLSVPPEIIERRIYLLRGQKVMLDRDLAELYQVETRALNQSVRRNIERFPQDFMFPLTTEEMETWKSQIVTSNSAVRMSLRKPPLAFTELGIAMLSSVLKSSRAVETNILIMRAFVKLREAMASNRAVAEKMERIEQTQKQHGAVLLGLVQDVQRLKNPPVTRAIDFLRIPAARK